MENQELENQETQKTIDIQPLSKGRRMLVYLCDLLICFFAAFVVMNVAALPIGKAASNYNKHMDDSSVASAHRDQVLFDHNLLFYENEIYKDDFDRNLDYTSLVFMRYFCEEKRSDFAKYDVFANYFINIKNDKDAYITLLKERDEPYQFFEYDKDGLPILKEVYREQFKPGLPPVNEIDEMSKEGHNNFVIFKDKIFTSCYNGVMADIKANDLISNGISFNAQQQIVDEQIKYVDILMISASYISMIFVGLILFLVVPLVSKNGKTISMMMMHVERVGINNIFLLSKAEVALTSLYQIVSCLGCLLFILVPNVTIAYAFRLSPLLFVALTSMAIVLVSFIFLLCNKFNRTLFDYCSRTVMISTDSLDEIYRAKGYNI